MRGSFLDFTRGSQVAETVGMMFTTALRPMFWTVIGLLVAAIDYQLWQHTQHGDNYYWMMHSYAAVWHYFQFNPSHLIGLKMAAGDIVRVPISLINSYPPLIAAWARLTNALIDGLIYGLGLGIPLSVIAAIGLRRFGHDLTERKHTRGATVGNLALLLTAVIALNRVQETADRRQIAAKLYRRKALLKMFSPTARAEIEAVLHVPYTIAGVPYPWRAEQSHTMVVGTTGTGKSTAMKDLLRQIKARGDRAVVFDLTGTYVEGFYNKDTDILLNPFDSRCPAWSPFADAHTREHFKEVSQALIPMTENGDSFWQETARMLFVETCVRLVQQGRGNNKALAEVLMTSKLKDLHAHVARTIAAPLTDPEAKRMAESIRATFNTYAQALMTLPDEGALFSIRDWVLGIDLAGWNGDDEEFEILPVVAPVSTKSDTATGNPDAPVASAKVYIIDPITGDVFDDDGTIEVAGEGQSGSTADASPDEHSPAPDVIAKARSAATALPSDAVAEGSTAASAADGKEPNPSAETPRGSVLFVAAQHVNLRSVRVLLTMWITTAINTLMSMRGDQRDIRLWFLIDEIGALHNIPAIVAGMQTSRNYGGAFVLGVHTMAQLRETYGDNNAETISSLAKTKLLMNTRDRGTQDWESEQIGEGEWTELEENWSYGVDNVRDAASLQRKIKLEPLVLPTEFGELPDLHGYLKFPQGLPAARVQLTYVKYRRRSPGFIERVIAPLELPGFDNDEAVAPKAVSAGPVDRPPAPSTAAVETMVRYVPTAAARDTQTAPPAAHATVAKHRELVSTAVSDEGGDGETAAADAKPNDGGEGFQTAVASEPPERHPTDDSRLFAAPREVAAGPPALLGISEQMNIDRTGAGSPAAITVAAEKTSSVASGGDRPGDDMRHNETPTVSLAVQELWMNFNRTGKGHHDHHGIAGTDAWTNVVRGVGAAVVRDHLAQQSGRDHVPTALQPAAVTHALDRDDDELGR